MCKSKISWTALVTKSVRQHSEVMWEASPSFRYGILHRRNRWDCAGLGGTFSVFITPVPGITGLRCRTLKTIGVVECVAVNTWRFPPRDSHARLQMTWRRLGRCMFIFVCSIYKKHPLAGKQRFASVAFQAATTGAAFSGYVSLFSQSDFGEREKVWILKEWWGQKKESWTKLSPGARQGIWVKTDKKRQKEGGLVRETRSHS